MSCGCSAISGLSGVTCGHPRYMPVLLTWGFRAEHTLRRGAPGWRPQRGCLPRGLASTRGSSTHCSCSHTCIEDTCSHMHTLMHMHTHMETHLHTCSHSHTYPLTYMCVYTCTYSHTCTHTHLHMRSHSHTFTSARTDTSTLVFAHMHTCATHTHTRAIRLLQKLSVNDRHGKAQCHRLSANTLRFCALQLTRQECCSWATPSCRSVSWPRPSARPPVSVRAQ